jgi:multidrug transporter EmrE-like cation transporter
MTTSQWLMLMAVGGIGVAWIVSWVAGRRSRSVQQIFAALCLQAVAAVLLSFSSDSLPLSLAFAGIILGAVVWLIQIGSRRAQAITAR